MTEPVIDAFLLSRIQFGFTVTFHFLFPAFTIGLAWWLAALEFNWLRTRDERYKVLYKFWIKVFAVSFGLGVVSGVVMSYQFGTNWSGYAQFAGSILGPLIGYEVITAFFLEASFLGIMLFGWNKVGDRMHFFATCMVAFGTMLSAFWILSANSWMQTPAGHEIVDGRAVPVDWMEIIFNPSFVYRFPHTVVAAFLTTAFAIAGLSAFMLLRGRRDHAVVTSFSMALWFATIFVPIQIFLGDQQGLNVRDYQPAKLAAMEGHWRNEPGQSVPLILFGIPDEQAEETKYAIEVPHLSSLIITHSWDGTFPGLSEFAADERPPVFLTFWMFRIMVGIGLLMLVVAGISLWLRWKGRLYDARWFHWTCFAMIPSGFIAVTTGWYTAEIGRQPYVVHGLLRTSDALSPISTGEVAGTLIAFVVVYTAVFAAGTYYLFKIMRKGPEIAEEIEAEAEPGMRPKRPFAVPDEALEGGSGRTAPTPAE